MPAACAPWTPSGLSSTTAHAPVATPIECAAWRNKSGAGFGRATSDEEKRYFETTPERRAIMAALYFGLAALLAASMKLIHGPIAP